MMHRLLNNQFLFSELVKRDFKKKYKRTVLGMLWSILSPLFMLAVMAVIFTQFFGNNTEHYIIYLFSGQIIFNYFMESTSEGMNSLVANASIFTKINVPKYLFLFSKNISALINFGLILVVYFFFVYLISYFSSDLFSYIFSYFLWHLIYLSNVLLYSFP